MILQGDCLEQLKTLPDESVDMCVTSPPYYGLRDYGTGEWVGGKPNCKHEGKPVRTRERINENYGQGFSDVKNKLVLEPFKQICPLCGAVRVDKQIGLEESPDIYIHKLTQIFHEVMRVLKPEGTLWVNIGDSYANSTKEGTKKQGNAEFNKNRPSRENTKLPAKSVPEGIKQKDLIGIPWMLAFALREDGWYLRQDIIWHKPNPMPESVKDRCTKSHEYIFLLSKKQKYYFDHEAIKEEAVGTNKRPRIFGAKKQTGTKRHDIGNIYKGDGNKRSKRDVWRVPVKPLKEAHFATFPEELIEPCILAGCPKDGVVLDPFFGAGTVGVVATKLSRRYIGIELNPEYVEIANKRIDGAQLSLQGLV